VDYVTLGKSGPEVSRLGLGCMGMSEFYGKADQAESLATLERAIEVGVQFLDTADAYGAGANERLLGQFLAAHRDDVVLATKFGPVRDPETGQLQGIRGDAEYVGQACEASLRRLGTDVIDVYYQHVPDPKVPIEESVGAMAELVTAGKVRHLGLSNLSAEQVRAAHAVHPIAVVQREWSLFTRDDEESVVPVCAELGIGYAAYSPLGRGFLTGVYTSTEGLAPDDIRRAVPRFVGADAARNRDLIAPLRRVAEAHGATPAQVALAWLLSRGEALGLTVVPIPGTTRRSALEENAAASTVSLSAADLAALDPLAAGVAGAGRPAVPPAARS
jgi:aryl-alcohol dehydrogenase-like predicted oxidoreductase